MGNATAHWSPRTYRKRKTEFPRILCLVSECIKIVRMSYKMGNSTAHWSSRTYRNRKTEFPHIGYLQNRPLARFARCRLYSQIYKYNSSFDGDLLFCKIGQTWLRIMGDMQDKWPKQGHFGQNKAIPCSFAVWVKKQGILCKPVKKEGDSIKQQNGAIQCSSSEDNRGGNGMQEKPEEIECNEERPIARAGATASPV